MTLRDVWEAMEAAKASMASLMPNARGQDSRKTVLSTNVNYVVSISLPLHS